MTPRTLVASARTTPSWTTTITPTAMVTRTTVSTARLPRRSSASSGVISRARPSSARRASIAATRTNVTVAVLPKERNGTGTPVRGRSCVVPEKITSHCATSNVARPTAVTTRSGVRFRAPTISPCPATAATHNR